MAVSVDLNILPPQYRPREISPMQVILALALFILLIGLAPAYLALTLAHTQTAALQLELAGLKAALAQPQDQSQLESLQKQIDQTRAEIERLRSESDRFSVKPPLRAPCIAAAIASLTPRLRILTITEDGKTYDVTGQAGSQALVLDYARALQASNYFARVRIVSMVNADPLGIAPDVQFVIEMVQ